MADIEIAQRALAKARAVLPKAKASLKGLRSLNKPPDANKSVLDTVCILMGNTWDAAQRMLGDSKFHTDLAKVDVVSPSVRSVLRAFVSNPDMAPDVIEKKSLSVAWALPLDACVLRI